MISSCPPPGTSIHRSKVLKFVVKMISSDLEIMFPNAELIMGTGISSSPVSLAVLGRNAVKSSQFVGKCWLSLQNC